MVKTNKDIRSHLLTLNLLPWITVLFTVILPFSFSDGLAPIWYLGTAIIMGGVGLFIFLMSWKTNNMWWSMLYFIFVVFISKTPTKLFSFDPEIGHSLQWLFVALMVVGGISYFKKQQLIEHCGLQEMNVLSWSDEFSGKKLEIEQDPVLQDTSDKLLKKYQTYSYEKLSGFIGNSNRVEFLDLKNSEGVDSQIIMDVLWDNKKGGDIQVICEIVSASASSYDGFVRQISQR